MAKADIILLEPDSVLGSIYCRALEAYSYRLRHVYNAQDAIIAADDHMPDLVICELQLVSHSGIEFLYEFRSYADWQLLPVIVVSAVPPIEFKSSQKGLEEQLGIQRYLYKSQTSVSLLLRTVEELLQNEPAKN